MSAALALSETLPGMPVMRSLARLVTAGKIYGAGETAVTALADASLDIVPGEVTLIEGPSGSGKTTLISILGLLLKPTSGEVRQRVDALLDRVDRLAGLDLDEHVRDRAVAEVRHEAARGAHVGEHDR